MDAIKIYTTGTEYQFGWNTSESKVTTMHSEPFKALFKPMILSTNKETLGKILRKNELWEGLIVFEYDHKAMKARFKLFDIEGNELALIKLPLEPDGAMKHSLFKHVRKAALTALGLNVRFSP